VRIKVAKDDNAIFGPVRNAVYLFNFGEGHGRKGTKKLVMGFSEVFPGLGVNMKAQVFLEVSFVPDGFIHVGHLVVFMALGLNM